MNAAKLSQEIVETGMIGVHLRTLDGIDDNSGGMGCPVPAPGCGPQPVVVLRRQQQERGSSSLNQRLRVRHLFGSRQYCVAAKRNQIMLFPLKAVSVLLDLSVRQLAVWTRPAAIEKEIVWGERSHRYSLCGWQGRRGLGKEHPWLQKQFKCLPSIARLVKDGRLNIFSYSELSFEESRGRRRMQGSFGDILSGLPIGSVHPALERSRFGQSLFRTAEDLQKFTSKESLTTFCKSLLYSDLNGIKQFREFWENLPDFEKNSINEIDQFRKLCDSLSPNHFADAFHLWTAERNRLDFFLTADEKFCNVIECNRNANLRCTPIAPSELVQKLGILNLDPVPEYNDQPHTYF